MYHHKRTASFMSKSKAVDTGWSWSLTTSAQRSMKTQALIKIREKPKLIHFCDLANEILASDVQLVEMYDTVTLK